MDIITEAKDAVQAINEITEWKVATTTSVKILGDLISRLVDRIEELELAVDMNMNLNADKLEAALKRGGVRD